MSNAQENKVRVWWIGTIIECHERNMQCPREFVSEAAYLALQAENEKLKQANKKLREGLEQYLNDENWMNGPIRKDGSRLVHNIPTMKRIAEHYIIQADKIEGGE